MRIINRTDLIGSDQHVRHPNYETIRLLLDRDGFGLTLTDITLNPGILDTYGYDDRLELAYCIEGRATLVDLATDTQHVVEPGTIWAAPPGSRFTFLAHQPTRLICVFNPALTGVETGIIDQGQPP
jgi:L-ectoine synthase